MSDIALIFNLHTIAAGDMSANIVGPWIDLSNVMGHCVQGVWTGSSPAGNIIIQGSLDQVNTKDLTTTAAGGSAGNLWNNVDGAHYPWIRVIYNFTSGTGALDVRVSGKKYV